MRLVLVVVLSLAATGAHAEPPSPVVSDPPSGGLRQLEAPRLNAQAAAAGSARRLTTLDALRQFAGFYHLQNVVLRGELVAEGTGLVLRSDAQEMRVQLAEGVRMANGAVEVRGTMVDIGRLERGDPRLGTFAEGRDESSSWPRPGEELFLRLANVTEAQPAVTPSVRALALEPWKFAGQKVTLAGNFRGRNLFGDLPGGPGKSRFDFVLRGAEGAIWVTGLRPRGRGFDLDIDRRVDSDRWLEVTGTVAHERGFVMLEATGVTLSKAPEVSDAPTEIDPPVFPVVPVEVVFSSPTDGETEVAPGSPIRIQFSRGLDQKTLDGQVRVTVAGGPAAAPGTEVPAFKMTYDGANRAIELRFGGPLPAFRTLTVEILDGLRGFDGAPVTPRTVTFTVGG